MAQSTDEWLDLVNDDDQVIGRVTRSEAWEKKLFVRVVNAFVVNAAGQLWIPRRTAHKRTFPDCLDMSVGGHVELGESYEAAFLRETREELNLNLQGADWREVAYFSPLRQPVSTFMRVYEIRSDQAPAFNQNDFSHADWCSPQALVGRIDAGEKAKGDLRELTHLIYLQN